MRNFKLTVAYDGTNYFGWQAQADKVTVQETLEAAVAQITGEKVRLSCQRPHRHRRPCLGPSRLFP